MKTSQGTGGGSRDPYGPFERGFWTPWRVMFGTVAALLCVRSASVGAAVASALLTMVFVAMVMMALPPMLPAMGGEKRWSAKRRVVGQWLLLLISLGLWVFWAYNPPPWPARE